MLATIRRHRNSFRSWRQKRYTLDRVVLLVWLRWEIRALDPTFLLPGDNLDDDVCISIVADQMVGRPIADVASFIALHESRIDALRATARMDPNTRMAASHTLIQDHKEALAFGLTAGAEKFLTWAKALHRDATLLDEQQERRVRRMAEARMREVRRRVADRKGFSFPAISLADVAGLAAFISLLLFCAGFFHVTLLLRSIGLDASLYFSIPDYLAASAFSSWVLGISAMSALVSFLWGVYIGSRRSEPERAALRRQVQGRSRLVIAFVALYIVPIIFTTALLVSRQHYAAAYAIGVPAIGLPLAMWFAQFLATRAFRSGIMATSLLTVTFVLAVSVVGSVLSQSESLKSGKWAPGAQVDIRLKRPELLDVSNLLVLTGSTGYVVLWSNEKREAYVLPRDAIEMIRGRAGGLTSEPLPLNAD